MSAQAVMRWWVGVRPLRLRPSASWAHSQEGSAPHSPGVTFLTSIGGSRPRLPLLSGWIRPAGIVRPGRTVRDLSPRRNYLLELSSPQPEGG